MQPGNRYYLFKDLIRCNCLDVTQTIKFLTLLYTARGFLSFCPPWGLTPSPSLGRGVHKHHCSPPAAMHWEQQPCRQLPACSPAVQRMLSRKRHVPPWPPFRARITPAAQRAAGTVLRGAAARPELSRAGSPGPSRGWIFADFVLPILLPSLPDLTYWLGIGKTFWVNKELFRMRS